MPREGKTGLSVDKDKEGARRRKSQPPKERSDMEGGAGKPKKKRAAAPEFGNALRSVYQRTVEESIPPEMLDLLGKLG